MHACPPTHSVEKPTIIEIIRLNRLCWFGHVQRMEENIIPKRVLYMNLGTRVRGRPRNRWQDVVREDWRIIGGEGWQEKVHNREEWKKLLRRARNCHILQMPTEWMNESSTLIMEAISSSGMSGHFTLYQTTLHCILRDSHLLTFMLEVLNVDGRKSTSNIHLQIGKWQSEKKRKCSFTAAMYYFTFWLPQWTKFSSVSCKCHALCLENQRLKNLATAPTRFWLHTCTHKHLARNFICRHIYQHFTITTHYYIVFYHFNNS